MSGPTSYAATGRTVPTRSADRAHYDQDVVHAILDAGYLCHLGFLRDGAPVVLPTLYVRIGARLYLHGSTGSRPMLNATVEGGLPVCVTVTHVDGVVLARSAMHHSLNYRSVVAHGTAQPIRDPEEKAAVLRALVDQVVPGRAADSRPANAKELAATAVLALDLDEVSAKIRTGDPVDETGDLSLPHWSGVLPVRSTYATPVPAQNLDPDVALPDYLSEGHTVADAAPQRS